MRKLLIRILVRLLKRLSNDKIGIYYASKDRIMKQDESFEKFVVLIGIIEKFYKVRFDSLIKRTRKPIIKEKRQMLETLAYKYTGLTTSQIGGKTRRDHATILHSKKRISDLRETDRLIASDYNKLCKIIEKTLYT